MENHHFYPFLMGKSTINRHFPGKSLRKSLGKSFDVWPTGPKTSPRSAEATALRGRNKPRLNCEIRMQLEDFMGYSLDIDGIIIINIYFIYIYIQLYNYYSNNIYIYTIIIIRIG